MASPVLLVENEYYLSENLMKIENGMMRKNFRFENWIIWWKHGCDRQCIVICFLLKCNRNKNMETSHSYFRWSSLKKCQVKNVFLKWKETCCDMWFWKGTLAVHCKCKGDACAHHIHLNLLKNFLYCFKMCQLFCHVQ